MVTIEKSLRELRLFKLEIETEKKINRYSRVKVYCENVNERFF